MNSNLEIGLISSVEIVVLDKYTAKEQGSGTLDVFATPAMIALMENAAASTVESKLENGYTTVGTEINIKHLSATPLGMKVRAIAELISIEDRKLNFKVEAFDEVEKIGEGLHTRFIIESEKFKNRVSNKSNKN